jgi:hypothetical protein
MSSVDGDRWYTSLIIYVKVDKANMTTVNITLDVPKDLSLQGELFIPHKASRIIVFAHGSGSGSSSLRNQYLVKYLNKDSLTTILVDLLTQHEENIDTKTQKMIQSGRTKMPGLVLNKFNITLPSELLATITVWILQNQNTKNLWQDTLKQVLVLQRR